MSFSKTQKFCLTFLAILMVLSITVGFPAKIFATELKQATDLVTEQIPNVNKVEITDPDKQDVPLLLGQDPANGNNIIIQHIKHITDDNTVERKPFTPVKDSSASIPSKQTVASEVYKTKTHDLTLVSENDSQKSVTGEVYDSFPIRNKQGLYIASFSRKVEKNLLKFSY